MAVHGICLKGGFLGTDVVYGKILQSLTIFFFKSVWGMCKVFKALPILEGVCQGAVKANIPYSHASYTAQGWFC